MAGSNVIIRALTSKGGRQECQSQKGVGCQKQRSERGREELESAIRPALQMAEEARAKGLLTMEKARKLGSPFDLPLPPEETQLGDTLIFSITRPTVDF